MIYGFLFFIRVKKKHFIFDFLVIRSNIFLILNIPFKNQNVKKIKSNSFFDSTLFLKF